jgi:hypothetical protein
MTSFYTLSLSLLLSINPFTLPLPLLLQVSATTSTTPQHTFNPNPQFFASQYTWITLLIIIICLAVLSLLNIGYQQMRIPTYSKIEYIKESREAEEEQ